MFAGNILKQPAYKDRDFKVVGELRNTDIVMTNTFWLGVYPGLTNSMLDYMIDSVLLFMENARKGIRI